MSISRLSTLSPLIALVLGAGACATPPGAGAPSPTPTFQTIDEAKDCARDALVRAGFLPETVANPGAAGGTIPAETPTSVSGRLITPLGDGRQIDYATAVAHVHVGPQGDTTVTVGVHVETLLQEHDQSGWTVSPLSSSAVRARDAVQTRCIVVA